jgi:cation diffusion facilitator family transporter
MNRENRVSSKDPENLAPGRHPHLFNPQKKSSERKTRYVVLITIAMMAAEIVAGWLFGSMALFADGCHMGTHAAALSVSLLAYYLARRHAGDNRYAFGTWKIEILGAFSSAIILGIIGIFMIGISAERFLHPLSIRYNDALLVAVIGLAVNLVCAVILNAGHRGPGHHHDHPDHGHRHGHEHTRASTDLNLRSAYLHVVADALTSAFAIAALLGAKLIHWNWLDPFMGLVGAGLIIRWSYQLIRETANILLDREMDSPLTHKISQAVESDGDSRVCDLHLWRVGQDNYACALSVVAHARRSVHEYKERLEQYPEIVHVTIEIND